MNAELKPPTPILIRYARDKAGHSDISAAAAVHVSRITFWNWVNGKSKIDLGRWELYLIKTRQQHLFGRELPPE